MHIEHVEYGKQGSNMLAWQAKTNQVCSLASHKHVWASPMSNWWQIKNFRGTFFFNLGTSCSYFHRTSFNWTLNILWNILFFPHYLQHYFKSSNEGVAKCVKGNGNHTAVCVETQYPHTHTVPHYVMTFNVFSDAAGLCCGAPGPYGILPCWLAGYQATWSHTHSGLHEACVCVRSWSICVTRVRTHDLCENLFAGTYALV